MTQPRARASLTTYIVVKMSYEIHKHWWLSWFNSNTPSSQHPHRKQHLRGRSGPGRLQGPGPQLERHQCHRRGLVQVIRTKLAAYASPKFFVAFPGLGTHPAIGRRWSQASATAGAGSSSTPQLLPLGPPPPGDLRGGRLPHQPLPTGQG